MKKVIQETHNVVYSTDKDTISCILRLLTFLSLLSIVPFSKLCKIMEDLVS